MDNKNREFSKNTKKLVLSGLLFAAAIVLSIIEGLLPPLPIPVPGVRLGLSNIIVMYSLFFLGKSKAYTIGVLKAFFVFLTRGVIAGFLSLCGGILSLTVMTLLLIFFKDKVSYLIISVSGATFHNLGQFIAISLIYSNIFILAYLPFLVISGILAGIVTSILLKFILPAFIRLGFK